MSKFRYEDDSLQQSHACRRNSKAISRRTLLPPAVYATVQILAMLEDLRAVANRLIPT